MEISFLLILIAIGIGIFVLNNKAGETLGNKKKCPNCGHRFSK